MEKAIQRPIVVQEDQPTCVSIAVQTDSGSDDSGENSEQQVTYLLGPEFAIYVDSPLRAAYAGFDEEEDEDEEEEEEEEDSSDDSDQEESPRRRALGLLLDANVPFP